MKLGIGVSEDLPIPVQQRLAAHVESAGFASLWTNESSGRDGLLLCQAWATATTDLQLGVGVVPVWTRSPAQLAMACATLQEASGGRFLLGLGVSHAAMMGAWHGVEVRRPATAAAELLTLLAQLESGMSSELDGEVFSSRGFRLAVHPAPPATRRYLGAMGPRMLEVAGRHADGALLNWASADEITRAGHAVRSAAETVHRARDDVEVAAYVRVVVGPDRDTARAALAVQIARYAALPAYAAHFGRQGFAARVAGAEAARRGGADAAGLAEALGEEMLDALGWAGSAGDDPSSMLATYRDAGLDHLVARVVVCGDDPAAGVAEVVRTFDAHTPGRR